MTSQKNNYGPEEDRVQKRTLLPPYLFLEIYDIIPVLWKQEEFTMYSEL